MSVLYSTYKSILKKTVLNIHLQAKFNCRIYGYTGTDKMSVPNKLFFLYCIEIIADSSFFYDNKDIESAFSR